MKKRGGLLYLFFIFLGPAGWVVCLLILIQREREKGKEATCAVMSIPFSLLKKKQKTKQKNRGGSQVVFGNPEIK